MKKPVETEILAAEPHTQAIASWSSLFKKQRQNGSRQIVSHRRGCTGDQPQGADQGHREFMTSKLSSMGKNCLESLEVCPF